MQTAMFFMILLERLPNQLGPLAWPQNAFDCGQPRFSWAHSDVAWVLHAMQSSTQSAAGF